MLYYILHIVFMTLIVSSKLFAFVQRRRGKEVGNNEYAKGEQTPSSYFDSDSEAKHGSLEFLESTAKIIPK